MSEKAIRGSAVTFVDNPFDLPDAQCTHYETDAIVVIEDGLVKDFGPATKIRQRLGSNTEITEYKDSLILPGFIDCHTHYVQTPAIAAFGKQLIDWLNSYIFVTEQAFTDKNKAEKVAQFFLRQCLRAGTTSAAVFCSVYPQSVDAFFEASHDLNMRNIAGQVLMDSHAPKALTQSAYHAYDEIKDSIGKWHNCGRQLYAVSPRFAATSSPQQLSMAGSVWAEHPGTYLQSHLAENREELAWVKGLFPQNKDYVDIYDHYGHLGPRAIFGHANYLSENEWQRLHDTGTAIAHCPTSGLFLGSGLFKLASAINNQRPVRLGLATDLGAGTSFSMLQTMNEAYKIAQLNNYPLTAAQAFYMATRGAAQALYLDHKIGSIAPGMEADFVVLDLHSTDLIDFRMQYAQDIFDVLFIQMMLADDRATRATYIAGNLHYHNPKLEF